MVYIYIYVYIVNLVTSFVGVCSCASVPSESAMKIITRKIPSKTCLVWVSPYCLNRLGSSQEGVFNRTSQTCLIWCVCCVGSIPWTRVTMGCCDYCLEVSDTGDAEVG